MELASRVLEYSKLEKQYAEELKQLAESLNHPVLKALFLSIAQDSMKHSMIFETIAKLLSQTQPFIALEELEKIANAIDRHILTESRMLEDARKLLLSVEDPRIKLLVAAIAEDEARHHALLVNIKEKIAEKETLTEEIFWDMVWKDSPWHGTPGG